MLFQSVYFASHSNSLQCWIAAVALVRCQHFACFLNFDSVHLLNAAIHFHIAASYFVSFASRIFKWKSKSHTTSSFNSRTHLISLWYQFLDTLMVIDLTNFRFWCSHHCENENLLCGKANSWHFRWRRWQHFFDKHCISDRHFSSPIKFVWSVANIRTVSTFRKGIKKRNCIFYCPVNSARIKYKSKSASSIRCENEESVYSIHLQVRKRRKSELKWKTWFGECTIKMLAQ